MEQKHRDRMDQWCELLVPKIDLVRLWPKLLEYKIFDRDDVNNPRWTKDLKSVETVKDVYLTIKTRGPNAFINFLNSLKQTGHENLAEVLDNQHNTYSNNNIQLFEQERVQQMNSIINGGSNAFGEAMQESEDNFFMNIQSATEPLQIKVLKAEEFLDGPAYENVLKYPMRSNPRGLVLIISNINYKNEDPRISAQHDTANLIALFTQMGFEVIPYDDLTGETLVQRVKEFSERPDLRKVDSCFIIITSHGGKHNESGETEIQGVDYQAKCNTPNFKKVLCSEIIHYFTSEACPHLAGKPKIFMFQLCRGDKRQIAVTEPRHKVDSLTIFGNSIDGICSNVKKDTMRNYADILVAYATMEGYVAHRDKITGSWFIQILCEVFMNHAYKTHLEDLLKMVDTRLAPLRTAENECQTLSVKSLGFNRHCYLNPGLFES